MHQKTSLSLFDRNLKQDTTAGAAATRSGAAVSAVDLNQIVISGTNRLVVVGNRCNCRTCCTCGVRRGVETRQNLLSETVLKKFANPVLLTFTVDPKRFESPEKAHDYVKESGLIRRTMRLLDIKTWVWVLEFQKNTWPHWHLLVDLSERGRLNQDDLRRVWRLWRDKWGVGGFDISKKDRRFKNAAHAMNYITKYLIKPAKSPFPEWFLKGSRRRLCQASKEVGRLTNKRESTESGLSVDVKKRRPARTLIVRMLECGTRSVVLREKIDPVSLKSTFQYVGVIDMTPDSLVRIDKYLPAGVKVSHDVIFRYNYSKTGVCLHLPDGIPKKHIERINESIRKFKQGSRVA